MSEFRYYWENSPSKEKNLHIEVPGFMKNEIKVKLREGLLTVQASKRAHSIEKSRGFRSEHSFESAFIRSFSIPSINPSKFSVIVKDEAVFLRRKNLQRARKARA